MAEGKPEASVGFRPEAPVIPTGFGTPTRRIQVRPLARAETNRRPPALPVHRSVIGGPVNRIVRRAVAHGMESRLATATHRDTRAESQPPPPGRGASAANPGS